MKKSKVILALLLAMLLIAVTVIFTGCGAKTAMTAEEFISFAESKGLEICDNIGMYNGSDTVLSALYARSEDGWGVEFYVRSDESNAIKTFKDSKSDYSIFKGNSSAETSGSGENYAYYSLTNSNSYRYVCRIDNTVLRANIPNDKKSDVKAFIKELGY